MSFVGQNNLNKPGSVSLLEATKPKLKYKDLESAIEHADTYGDQGWRVENFEIRYLGLLSINNLQNYDDIDSWLDFQDADRNLSFDEKFELLKNFRGKKWALMAREWLKNGFPPIVVISAPVVNENEILTQIGDGRGRINVAFLFNKKVPVYHMIWKGTIKENFLQNHFSIQKYITLLLCEEEIIPHEIRKTIIAKLQTGIPPKQIGRELKLSQDKLFKYIKLITGKTPKELRAQRENEIFTLWQQKPSKEQKEEIYKKFNINRATFFNIINRKLKEKGEQRQGGRGISKFERFAMIVNILMGRKDVSFYAKKFGIHKANIIRLIVQEHNNILKTLQNKIGIEIINKISFLWTHGHNEQELANEFDIPEFYIKWLIEYDDKEINIPTNLTNIKWNIFKFSPRYKMEDEILKMLFDYFQ